MKNYLFYTQDGFTYDKSHNLTNNTQKPITLELVTNDDDTNLENVA